LGVQAFLRIATLCITVLGFIYLWVPQTKPPRLETFQTAVLLTAPIAGVVGLNLLGFYPLPSFSHRLLLSYFQLRI
jgi:hypothetical protein